MESTSKTYKCHVKLYPTRRHTNTGPGYTPHLTVMDREDMLGVRFLDSLKLNEWVDARFEAMYDGVDYSALTTKEVFNVYEGPNCVGVGFVTETPP